MKNLSVLLNVVLLGAVVVLYILHFSQDTVPAAIVEENPVDTTTAEVVVEEDTSDFVPDFEVPATPALSFPIAYVNIDSINDNYKLIADQAKRLKRDLDRKTREIEKMTQETEEFYKTAMAAAQAGTATPEQLQSYDITLRERQQQIYNLQMELQDKTLQGQQDIAETTAKNITNYLIKYSEELNYSYVLGYQYGGPVLFKKDSLDITKDVLKGLNAEYKK